MSIDKENASYYYYSEILNYCDDSKFICVVRDPRDILASKKKRFITTNLQRYKDWKVLKKKKLEKNFSLLLDAISLKNYMSMFQSTISNSRLSGQTLLVQYERLVNEAVEATSEICAFLKIDFEQNMLEVQIANGADTSQRKSGRIYKSIGNYNQVFNRAEKMFLQWFFERELLCFNYHHRRSNFIKIFPGLVVIIIKSFGELLIYIYKRIKFLGWRRFLDYALGHVKLFFRTYNKPR